MAKFSFFALKKTRKSILDAVIIEVEAESWTHLVTHEEFYGIPINVIFLQEYLKTAYIMYGHTFDTERHSPRDLYEALTCYPHDHIVKVEGHNPDDDPPEKPLPPGWIH